MEQRELLGSIFLGEFPIAHKILRRENCDAREQELCRDVSVRRRVESKLRQREIPRRAWKEYLSIRTIFNLPGLTTHDLGLLWGRKITIERRLS